MKKQKKTKVAARTKKTVNKSVKKSVKRQAVSKKPVVAKKRIASRARRGEKRAVTAARYLARLKSFYFKNKRMPSYGEIAEMLKFKSKFAALYQANKWIDAGIISRDKAGKLLPGKQFQPLKVLGSVKAGWPSPAEEENADTISLDDWLIPNKEGSFMLKVTGDSMVGAGIMPGDMVIINRGRQAKSGDIVVAEVDRAWTVKYLTRLAGGKVVLKAANKKYRPITAKEELKVAGVVTAVVRKY